jgi:uncharacterized membrane protein YccC
MMKKLNLLLATAMIVVLTIVTNSVWAQGGGGPIPPHVLPLDGGIGALIAAGIATVVYLKKQSRSAKKE